MAMVVMLCGVCRGSAMQCPAKQNDRLSELAG